MNCRVRSDTPWAAASWGVAASWCLVACQMLRHLVSAASLVGSRRAVSAMMVGSCRAAASTPWPLFGAEAWPTDSVVAVGFGLVGGVVGSKRWASVLAAASSAIAVHPEIARAMGLSGA